MKFKDFIDSRISGILMINPYWLEYHLNLYHQGFYVEIYEDMCETRISMLESLQESYRIIGENL